ncbi:MAG: ribosome maturation factor RimP, partial [Gammaproteobacteria bacterium]|nr:ribosome maturation factor RimP [Gammaproteobacteria bacterium]
MGFVPIFYFRTFLRCYLKASKGLTELLDPVVTGMGYELVGLEFDGHQRVLRVYIDHPEGIRVEDCSKVSYQLSGVLDVEDPIPGRYQLEVSSPGMDRPLFTLDHFERFKGEVVRVQLSRPLEGRRRFKALIEDIDGHDLVLVEDGQTFRVPFDM